MARKWKAWWGNFEGWWENEQAKKDAERLGLLESLEKLKNGEVPPGYEDEDEEEEDDDF